MSLPQTRQGAPLAPSTRPAVTRGETQARTRYALLCLLMQLGALAACAKMGALRVPDMLVTLVALGFAFSLALRDSSKLPAYLVSIWVYAPLIRRLIDWRAGGFESLTALSLLPMMATGVLVIPLIPRFKRLPNRILQPLLLMAAPIGLGAALGLASYGPTAVIEAAGWLLPMLFVPYFATRPTPQDELWRLLRVIALLVGVSGLYGVFQYVSPPPWDRMWLVQSGMTSSMGQPVPFGPRAWGPMNSTGPAAAVWASAILIGVGNPRWRGPLKNLAIACSAAALLVSRVRSCWLAFVFGLLAWGATQGARRAGTVIGVGMMIGVLVVAALASPAGEAISDRLDTFKNLEQDNSFRARKSFLNEVVEMVLENPFGVGIGYTSAAKLSGGARLAAFDNGFGQVLYTLGLPGGAAWFIGLGLLFAQLQAKCKNAASRDLGSVAVALFAATSLEMAASFSFAGLVGLLTWVVIGAAMSPKCDLTTAASPFEEGTGPFREGIITTPPGNATV